MSNFYGFLLRSMGWKSEVSVEIPDKCVICVAPHTSNWDFIIGMVFYHSIGGKPHFLMKKSWFFFPLNLIFKALGGFPVDRSKKKSLTQQMAEEFDQRTHFQLAITPEGTRKKNAEWKTGFIRIAQKARVPITLAYLDYEKKVVGTFLNYLPKEDIELSLFEIKQFYKGVKGKHPELFSI